MSICKLCSSSKLNVIIKNNNFSIFQCLTCDNAFTFPSPGSIAYEEMDFHAKEVISDDTPLKDISMLDQEWRQSIIKQINLIHKRFPISTKILEIGCGEGILAEQLKKLGYDVTGIEPSPTASSRAAKRGIRVYTGYFPYPDLKEKFDLIIMSHVLEHIEDIETTFKDILCYSKPNAYLLFIQTNYKGIIPKKYGERWYAWVPEQHFWHFTPKGLSYIAKKFGYKKITNEFSSLVHYNLEANIKRAIKYIPFLRDQFHLLLKKDV